MLGQVLNFQHSLPEEIISRGLSRSCISAKLTTAFRALSRMLWIVNLIKLNFIFGKCGKAALPKYIAVEGLVKTNYFLRAARSAARRK
jgi:hypothetical protein